MAKRSTKTPAAARAKPFASADQFSASAELARQLAESTLTELRPVKGAIVVPQSLLAAFAASTAVSREAGQLSDFLKAIIVASNGQSEPGPLAAVLTQTQRRAPSWKDLAIWLAKELYGEKLDVTVWLQGVYGKTEPSVYTTVSIQPAVPAVQMVDQAQATPAADTLYLRNC